MIPEPIGLYIYILTSLQNCGWCIACSQGIHNYVSLKRKHVCGFCTPQSGIMTNILVFDMYIVCVVPLGKNCT